MRCRNTVKDGVNIISYENRNLIKQEIEKAKNWEALTMVIDGWTDDYKYRSYFGLVCILGYTDINGKIVRKKFTLQVKLFFIRCSLLAK